MTNTKKNAQNALTAWKKSTLVNLTDAYKKPSAAKSHIWNTCRENMAACGGWGLRIISYNTFMFTCGFLFTDPETGVIKFKHFTPTYTTIIDY